MKKQQVNPVSDALALDTPTDSTEIARVQWMPLSEALARCLRGEIEDGKTLVGLYMTHYLLTSEHASRA